MTAKVWEGSPKRNASSAKQSRSQKDWSTLQGDTLKGSTDKNKQKRNIGQREAKKYLRENCYYCIKCSTTNHLVTLMRRWYMNSGKQLYSYSQKLQECANGTRTKANNLTYMWTVEMKKRGVYNRERSPIIEGSES